MEMALLWHAEMHAPQPVQRSAMTIGGTAG